MDFIQKTMEIERLKKKARKQGALEELNNVWDLIGVVDKNGRQIELINYVDKRIKELKELK